MFVDLSGCFIYEDFKISFTSLIALPNKIHSIGVVEGSEPRGAAEGSRKAVEEL